MPSRATTGRWNRNRSGGDGRYRYVFEVEVDVAFLRRLPALTRNGSGNSALRAWNDGQYALGSEVDLAGEAIKYLVLESQDTLQVHKYLKGPLCLIVEDTRTNHCMRICLGDRRVK